MSMMGAIDVQDVLWVLVRVKRHQIGAIKTVTVGGEFEAYKDRKGRARKRRVNGTGQRVFLPEHLLRRAGFEVFLPVKKVLRKANRFSDKRVMHSQPLLVDWIFVAMPLDDNGHAGAAWAKLMKMDVVMGVLGTGGRPIIISEHRVVRLMRQWGGGHLSPACHAKVKRAQDFQPGQTFMVSDGPFVGFEFKVIDATDKSVRGTVDIFGRDTPLEFATAKLAALFLDQP